MIDHYQQSIFDGTEQSIYNQSIELIKTFEEVALQRNPVGYVVGYSGGKDSDVLVDLFRKSGVKFMVMHNHTTLDAPETVYVTVLRCGIREIIRTFSYSISTRAKKYGRQIPAIRRITLL